MFGIRSRPAPAPDTSVLESPEIQMFREFLEEHRLAGVLSVRGADGNDGARSIFGDQSKLAAQTGEVHNLVRALGNSYSESPLQSSPLASDLFPVGWTYAKTWASDIGEVTIVEHLSGIPGLPGVDDMDDVVDETKLLGQVGRVRLQITKLMASGDTMVAYVDPPDGLNVANFDRNREHALALKRELLHESVFGDKLPLSTYYRAMLDEVVERDRAREEKRQAIIAVEFDLACGQAVELTRKAVVKQLDDFLGTGAYVLEDDELTKRLGTLFEKVERNVRHNVAGQQKVVGHDVYLALRQAHVRPTVRNPLSYSESVHNVIAVRSTAERLLTLGVDASTEFNKFEIAVRRDRDTMAGVITAISNLNPTSITVRGRDGNGSKSIEVETTDGPTVLVLSAPDSDAERVAERLADGRDGPGISPRPSHSSYILMAVDGDFESHMEAAGPPGEPIQTLSYAAVHERAVDATLSKLPADLSEISI